MRDSLPLGRNIDYWRKQCILPNGKRLTIPKLAKRVGYHRVTVYLIIKNQRNVISESVPLFAKALGISVKELLIPSLSKNYIETNNE